MYASTYAQNIHQQTHICIFCVITYITIIIIIIISIIIMYTYICTYVYTAITLLSLTIYTRASPSSKERGPKEGDPQSTKPPKSHVQVTFKSP